MVLVKELQPAIMDGLGVLSGEVAAYCPVCKALQTLWFAEGRLTSTRKFSQYGVHVYHDCGSSVPCRLYRSY